MDFDPSKWQTDDASVKKVHVQPVQAPVIKSSSPPGSPTTNLAQDLDHMSLQSPANLELLRENVEFDEKLKRIVQDIYTPDEDGDNYLHQCIIHSKTHLIEGILKVTIATNNLSLINRQNNMYQTPLILATIQKMPDVALSLLQCGANPDLQDVELNTALHIASEYGLEEIVALLTSVKHDPAITNDQGLTSLFIAGKHKRLNIVQHLVECGHNINTQEVIGGRTLLHLAIETNDLELLYFLLGHENTIPEFEDNYKRKAITMIQNNVHSQKMVETHYPKMISLAKQLSAEDN